jgi:hypothetical protein
MGFDSYNRSLKIWESTETPTPKMGAHLGVWMSTHTLFHTLELPSWLMPLQAFTLVMSPRLRLQRRMYLLNKTRSFMWWKKHYVALWSTSDEVIVPPWVTFEPLLFAILLTWCNLKRVFLMLKKPWSVQSSHISIMGCSTRLHCNSVK